MTNRAGTDLTTVVAENIARFRRERGLSLGDLAARSGLSKQTLSLAERASSNPTVATLEAIAAGLGVTVRMLLTPWGSSVRVHRATDLEPGVPHDLSVVYGSGWVRSSLLLVRDADGPVSRPAGEPGGLLLCYVVSGTAAVGPTSESQHLSAGDSVRFPVDVAHGFEAVTRQAVLHLTRSQPSARQLGTGPD